MHGWIPKARLRRGEEAVGASVAWGRRFETPKASKEFDKHMAYHGH